MCEVASLHPFCLRLFWRSQLKKWSFFFNICVFCSEDSQYKHNHHIILVFLKGKYWLRFSLYDYIWIRISLFYKSFCCFLLNCKVMIPIWFLSFLTVQTISSSSSASSIFLFLYFIFLPFYCPTNFRVYNLFWNAYYCLSLYMALITSLFRTLFTPCLLFKSIWVRAINL